MDDVHWTCIRRLLFSRLNLTFQFPPLLFLLPSFLLPFPLFSLLLVGEHLVVERFCRRNVVMVEEFLDVLRQFEYHNFAGQLLGKRD